MRACEVCGNRYDKFFVVIVEGKSHTFDSFECAIHALAPRCDRCGCRIIGHALEADGKLFCCSHCLSELGVPKAADRSNRPAR